MTISGTMPGTLVMFPDVCVYTDTCVCKLHHVVIGVRTCHSVHMEHAYAHVHSHCHSHADIRPHMHTYKHAEIRVSSQSLPSAAHVCKATLLLQILIGVVSL